MPKPIPYLPLRTPIVDQYGNITRTWVLALEALQQNAGAGGSPGTPGTAPAQLAAGDWSLALVEYGFGDPTGQHEATVACAHIRATVTANSADVSFFSAFVYWGPSAPDDPSLYLDIGVNQPKASTGSTVIDFWIARPATTTMLQVVIGASSGTFRAVPTNVDLVPHAVSVTAVALPAQPTEFVAAVYYENRGGLPCGALAFTWTPPVDLEYFAGNVYKIDCDSSFVPLEGDTWDLVGNAISGFDQRVLNQWWATSGVGYTKFKVQSVSRVLDGNGHNLENTVGGPTSNLTIDASTGISPSGPPSQLTAGDWTLSLIEYGFGDPSGQHGDAVPVAHLRVTVLTNPADALYFSAFGYWGASEPVDLSQYQGIVSKTKASSGSTLIDFWIARPAATATLQVVTAACSASFQAFPTNVTLSAAKSVSVTAVALPAQPTEFVAAVYYENRGGLPCGALAFTWTPPADLEYFAAKVYKIDCDASFTPLAGATWALVGDAISGFDQRVLNQWWATSGVGYTKFKVQSLSRVLDASGHNLENTVGGPTSNLTIDASSGISPIGPPSQLAAGDWSLALVEYGFGDPTGQHGDAIPVAHLRVTVTANPGDVLYFSPFGYWGASPPSDVSQYRSIVSQSKASTGSTVIDFWIARPATTTSLQVVVSSSSSSFQAFPKNVTLSAAKSVSVTAVGLPAQPTAFTAAVNYQTRGGVPCGALAFTWTPPTDPEYFAANVYKIDCDASYAPLPGAVWDLVGNAISGFDQRDLNQWWPTAGVGYVKFKLQSVSRVLDATGHNLENTTSPPTANLTINASSGLDASSMNPLSIGAGLALAFSTLTAKVSSGIQFDASGNIVVKNGDGIAIDGTGKVTVNAGVGLQLSGGLITTKTSTGLTADGSGIYIPGGAITNALLAALAVAQTNLQDSSVSQTKIANAAIITAKIGTAQITTALCANAFVTNALLGNAVVGTANIQNAAITDALIVNCAVSKLLAGTATFTGDVVFQRSGGGGSVTINSTGVKMSNGGVGAVTISTNGELTITNNSGVSSVFNGNALSMGPLTCSSIQVNPGSITVGSMTAISFSGIHNSTSYQISGQTVIDGSRNAAFLQVTVNGNLAIDTSGAFVGKGVACTANGIGGTGHATYVTSVGWYYGGSNPTPINIGGTNYYLRGGILCTN